MFDLTLPVCVKISWLDMCSDVCINYLQIMISLCTECCQVTAKMLNDNGNQDIDSNETVTLSEENGLHCSGNSIMFNASNNLPLQLKGLYQLRFRIGNAAGCDNIPGTLTLDIMAWSLVGPFGTTDTVPGKINSTKCLFFSDLPKLKGPCAQRSWWGNIFFMSGHIYSRLTMKLTHLSSTCSLLGNSIANVE